MYGFMGSIAILGAGRGGNALLSILLGESNIQIIGISDIDPDAPGLKLAKKADIYTCADFKKILDKKPDIVINVTGDDAVKTSVLKYLKRKSPDTAVIDGKSAKLFWDLLEKRRQAKEDVKALLNETKELYRIGVALTSADELEEVLDTLLIETLRTLNVPAGSIALYDEKSDSLTLKASHGFSKNFSQNTQWKRRDGGITDHILSRRIPTIISDIEKNPFADNRILIKEGIKSIIAVPLFANDHITGILYLDDFKPRTWTEREIEFITLLGIQAAYAIEKFRLIEAISETKNYLRNVLDNSADIIVTTDTKGRVVEFNKGASRILGYSREEVTGKKAEKFWVQPEERHEILRMLESAGYVSNYETQLTAKDGRVVDVSLTLSYILSSKKGILGTVGISKDITEKKKLERAVEERNLELRELNEKLEEKVIERTRDLEKANRELERSGRLKSQFIATMSHELRTPLNSILGFSELLMDEVFGTLTEKQKRHVTNIHNSGSHLLQLINNILDIAKIESGKMELHYEGFSVHQAVSEVETVIRPLADKKRQDLITKIGEGVALIKADKVKFKQILYNLVSNAVKFTPEGGNIFIEMNLTGEGDAYFAKHKDICVKKDSCLRLSVIDTGIGIKREDHEKIFSEFEQVDSSFSRRYEGTGLGLALTKKLVELHGGEIFVESEEGKGSKFTVVVPLFDVSAVEKEAMPMEPAMKKFEYSLDMPKKRRGEAPLILVAEDDPSTSEILTLHLAQGGYRVAHVYNGDVAISRIRELKPFAVLLDVMMPGKDGWEILQEIKSDPELKDIPVIMSSVVDNLELGFALGATDYLVKPVDRISLLKKLSDLSFSTKKGRRSINILCIDDHVEVLELLTSILEPSGYNVISADSGKKGIEKALTYKPDLIILDLMMPEVDGFEVTQTLKSNSLTMDIPILILTAKDLTVDDRLRLAGRVETFMQKSHFTKEDLLLQIRDLETTYPNRAGLLDEVSGLFDHSYFQIRLAQEVSRAERYKNTFSLIMLDLDNFTEYIKIHGIHRANVVIKKIAEFLRKTMRGSDTVVRYGIDEFALILTNTIKPPAEAVAKRLLSYIDSYPFYGEEVMSNGKITVSVSVINYPRDASSPEELIFKAHQLLRKAKSEGGARLEVYGQ
ncbi:MAG: response regulator [Nitrospirae bacterium]|nr:response regulator [Nitrospirota bacterium]